MPGISTYCEDVWEKRVCIGKAHLDGLATCGKKLVDYNYPTMI